MFGHVWLAHGERHRIHPAALPESVTVPRPEIHELVEDRLSLPPNEDDAHTTDRQVLDETPLFGIPDFGPGTFVKPITAGGDPAALGIDIAVAHVFLLTQPQLALVRS
jgi:hypothetical protein